MTTPNEALRTILPIAGWGDTQAADVMFTGGADPVLPTPFRIGAAGAATLAASGLAATELWQVRTGRRQRVTVDLRQATAALRSGHYLQLAGTDVSSERNSIMGVYPTRDSRWSYLHCNFPNHRAAALRVLGVAEDRDAVARAVATWNAADLEEAIIAAKGAGGMARTQAEWARHPQAAAVAALPLMEIMRIGDSAPEPLPTGDRPLSGVRVLDLTRVLAGPTCARTLAEHGADVMKITGAHLPSLGYQEWDTGHGKLSAELDLRAPGDVDILRGLVRKADVFSQGYRPGSLANRGLSPEELAAIRPGLVYVLLCAFGHAGPWASRRGFDTVVQTVSGMTIRQAESVPGKTAEPQFYPVSAIDYCTGYLMAFGAMVALARRTQEGGSWLVRISLAQVGKWIVDLGEVPAAALGAIPAEFTAAVLGAALGPAWLSPPGVALTVCQEMERCAHENHRHQSHRPLAMNLLRRQFLHLAAGAAALPALSRMSWAQTYPSRPVRLLIGFSARGGADIVGRLIGPWLQERLGQPVVIENRPGAGTNVATEALVRAPADGYTLGLIGLPNAINATLYDKLSFNFIHDVTPVAGILRTPEIMVVNLSVPAKTLSEFIAHAKANPGKINRGSAGNGSVSHVAGELLMFKAGLRMVHVPYRGVAPALTNLLGGQVQVVFGAVTATMPYISTR